MKIYLILLFLLFPLILPADDDDSNDFEESTYQSSSGTITDAAGNPINNGNPTGLIAAGTAIAVGLAIVYGVP